LRGSKRLRWPAALIVIGVLFVLAEILTARVVLSQIGNIVVLCGSVQAAWLIARSGTDGRGLVSGSANT
jgi:membrane-bound ClpP family serine protease